MIPRLLLLALSAVVQGKCLKTCFTCCTETQTTLLRRFMNGQVRHCLRNSFHSWIILWCESDVPFVDADIFVQKVPIQRYNPQICYTPVVRNSHHGQMIGRLISYGIARQRKGIPAPCIVYYSTAYLSLGRGTGGRYLECVTKKPPLSHQLHVFALLLCKKRPLERQVKATVFFRCEKNFLAEV